MSKLSSHAQTLDVLARVNLGMAAGLGAAFFAVLDTRMGAAPWLLALVAAAPYLANLFAPAWVGQSQRWGIRLLVVVSLVASAGVLLLLSVAQTPAVFALVVVLYYLFYGVSDPLYVALAELVYPERTGTKLGRAQALFNAAHIGAALLAGWLLDRWEHLFPWRIVREDRMIRRILLFLIVSGTGMVMMLPVLPLIEVRLVGLDQWRDWYAAGGEQRGADRGKLGLERYRRTAQTSPPAFLPGAGCHDRHGLALCLWQIIWSAAHRQHPVRHRR